MSQKLSQAPCQLNTISEQTFDSYSFFDQDHDSNQLAPIQGQLSPQRYKNPEDEVLSDSNSNQDHQRAFNGFEEDPFIEEPRRKVVKLTTEYSQSVPVTSPTKSKKGKKYLGLKSKNFLRAQDAAKKETLFGDMSIEDDPLLSCVEYTYTFKLEKGYFKFELDVNSLPHPFDKMGSDVVKNYPKSLGDHFIRYLFARHVVQEKQLIKDCITSLTVWNALFDVGKREITKFKSKKITNFILALSNLSEQITQQDWISYFLEFASTFNPEIYRTSTDIQKVERKQAYKLLSKNLKEAAMTLCRKLQSVGILEKITDFEIDRINKKNVTFFLKFDSSIEVEPLINQLNKCDVGVSVVNLAANTTICQNLEMMEEEKDDMHILPSALGLITQSSNLFEGFEENAVFFPAQEQQQQEREEGVINSFPAFLSLDNKAGSREEWLQFNPELQNIENPGDFSSQLQNYWEDFISYPNENNNHDNQFHFIFDEF